MKKILSLLVVIVLSITLVSCQEDTEGYLVVGLEADYPPFNWMDTSPNNFNLPLDGLRNSYVDGYDVQIAKHIASELGLNLKIKMIDWDALIPALNTGDIDLIIAGMSPRPDRLEQIDFTEPYYVSKHVAIVLAEGPLANATTIADLEGMRGVGQKGTAYADIIDWLAENHGVTNLPVMNTVPEIAQQIIGGNADFTIVEEPVAIGLVKTDPRFTIAVNTPVEDNIFELDDSDRYVSIGVKKGRDDLVNKINDVLNSLSIEQRNKLMEDAIGRAEH